MPNSDYEHCDIISSSAGKNDDVSKVVRQLPVFGVCGVQTGNLETVRSLTELDSRLDAADARGQGIVELSSARRDCEMLSYYTRLDSERLHVWKRLVKLMKSDFEEEYEPAAWCTHELTLRFEDVSGINLLYIALYYVSRVILTIYTTYRIHG